MPHPLLIENVHIKNFGCVQDLEMNLTPLHALIGPNDSGKTTILRAVRTGMQLINGNFTGGLGEKPGMCKPFHPGFHENASCDFLARVFEKIDIKYLVQIINKDNAFDEIRLRSAYFQGIGPFSQNRTIWDNRDKLLKKCVDVVIEYDKTIKEGSLPLPRMVRIDPDSLREPGSLIPSSQPIDLQEKGMGLVSVLDALMNRNIDGFLKVREQVGRLFPSIASIGMKNIEVEKGTVSKILEFQLKNGTRIPAQFMSEGVLYYLTFFAMQYLEPASIILVEEPENGLHPSRIKDIMTILREISKTTQVLIATHSPLVINEMEPEEVSIVRRDAEMGTSVEPMEKTKDFDERAKIYALGELWLSYADGVDEKELRGDDSK